MATVDLVYLLVTADINCFFASAAEAAMHDLRYTQWKEFIIGSFAKRNANRQIMLICASADREFTVKLLRAESLVQPHGFVCIAPTYILYERNNMTILSVNQSNHIHSRAGSCVVHLLNCNSTVLSTRAMLSQNYKAKKQHPAVNCR